MNKNKNTKNHLLRREKKHFDSLISNLFFFDSKIDSNQVFIVIPSLFNSSEILFFNEDESFIDYLTSLGDVYLFEWIENNTNQTLQDYAQTVANLISLLNQDISKKINLVGHCIGGNLAMFSYFIESKFSSLLLMTTPWDYSHFKIPQFQSKFLGINENIKNMDIVPRLYIQMMFFLLFPKNHEKKITKYFSLKSNSDREKYLRIEHWLASGIGLSHKLYSEIIDDIIEKNVLMLNDFRINNTTVSLDLINVPTCIISAKEDQVAPFASIEPLKGIKKSNIITVNGGHIGYLINNDCFFKESYKTWLNNLQYNQLY